MRRLASRICAAGLLVPCLAAAQDAGSPWLEPDQRAALERSGRIDPEVVEGLASRGAASVIVELEVRAAETGAASGPFTEPAARAALWRAGGEVLEAAGARFLPVHRLRSIPALSGAADVEGVLILAAHPAVARVFPDPLLHAFLEESLPLIGIPPLAVDGLRGARVTVALLDTGVDFRHKALEKARGDEACFCAVSEGGCCPNGLDRQRGRKSAADRHGHGTHVAGIVASRGKAGAPRGVAPRAKVLAVKILSDRGEGLSSNGLAALDWILAERTDVDVVNMSFGTSVMFKGLCDNKGYGGLYSVAVDGLVARGVVVTAASGNGGSRKEMPMPACLRNTVSVGAGFDADYAQLTGSCTQIAPGPEDVACFSNRPPQLDLVAPGVVITSAGLRRGAATRAGTSMAAPHVAGCAALLAGGFPGAVPAELVTAMIDSGAPVTDNKGRRFPRLDCEAAAASLLSRP